MILPALVSTLQHSWSWWLDVEDPVSQVLVAVGYKQLLAHSSECLHAYQQSVV